MANPVRSRSRYKLQPAPSPVQGEETAVSLERWTLAAGGHIVAARTQVTTATALRADLQHAVCKQTCFMLCALLLAASRTLCMEQHLKALGGRCCLVTHTVS